MALEVFPLLISHNRYYQQSVFL